MRASVRQSRWSVVEHGTPDQRASGASLTDSTPCGVLQYATPRRTVQYTRAYALTGRSFPPVGRSAGTWGVTR